MGHHERVERSLAGVQNCEFLGDRDGTDGDHSECPVQKVESSEQRVEGQELGDRRALEVLSFHLFFFYEKTIILYRSFFVDQEISGEGIIFSFLFFRTNVDKFRRTLPLITDLKNPAMRPRHWQRVKETVDRDFDEQSPEFTLDAITEMEFQNFAEQISDISNSATMELAIEIVSDYSIVQTCYTLRAKTRWPGR